MPGSNLTWDDHLPFFAMQPGNLGPMVRFHEDMASAAFESGADLEVVVYDQTTQDHGLALRDQALVVTLPRCTALLMFELVNGSVVKIELGRADAAGAVAWRTIQETGGHKVSFPLTANDLECANRIRFTGLETFIRWLVVAHCKDCDC